MKKFTPVTVALLLFAVLLTVNAVLLVARAPRRAPADEGGGATPSGIATSATPASTNPAAASAQNAQRGSVRVMEANPTYYNGIGIRFDMPGERIVFPENYRGISISPAIEGGFSVEIQYWDTRRLTLRGAFAPETTYTVRIPAGLQDSLGNTLKKDAVVVVTIPAASPNIEFRAAGFYLQANGSTKIPLRLINAETITYRLRRHYENNINFLSPNLWWWKTETYLDDFAESTKKYNLPRNRRIDALLNLREVFGDIPPGLYKLSASAADSRGYSSSDGMDFIVSDIAVQTAIDSTGRRAAVFARSLSRGEPIKDADITVLSAKNQTVAKGRTNAAGAALLVFLPEFDTSKDMPKSIMVKTSDDFTFEELDYNHAIAAPGFDKGSRPFDTKPEALVFTERGTYRPGEKIAVSVFARSFAADGTSRAITNAPAVILLRDPKGKAIARSKVEFDSHGYADAEFTLDKDAPTGTYETSCGPGDDISWGRAYPLVAQFVPDRIKVSLKSSVEEGAAVGPGEEVAFTPSVNYYFGPAVTDYTYSLNVSMSSPKLPPHMEGWTVGTEDGYRMAKSSKGRAEMAANGISFDDIAPEQKAYRPMTVVGEISVAEPGSRSVTARSDKFVYNPTPAYIGLKQGTSDSEAARLGIVMLPAKAGDEPLPSRVFLSIERLEWTYELYDADSRWRYRWIEKRTPMKKFGGEVDVLGTESEVALRGLPEGHYEVTAESDEMKTVFQFWHYAGEGGSRSADPKNIVFELDRERYAPGETARVTFEAQGDGEAFVVCGERKIDANVSFPVKTGKNSFDFIVPPTVSGDKYFFGVTAVSRSDENGLMRQFGLLALPVDISARKLAVAIEAPEKTEPKSEVEVVVRLRDAAGEPVSGLARVYAVDEGILALTNYKTPDPFDFFHCDRICGFKFYDLYDDIIPDLAFLEEKHVGGDSGSEAAGRRLGIKTAESAVVVAPPVIVGDSGEAAVRLSLPDHTGAMRIMAVAAGETLLGSAERQVILRDAVSVLASAPRAAAPGDEFDISFRIVNNELENGAFTFEAALPEGVSPAAGGEIALSGTLPKGASTNLVARVKVADDAVFLNRTVQATLSMGGRQYETSAYLTARPANVRRTKTSVFVVAPGDKAAVSVDSSEWMPGAESKLEVMSSPAIGIGEAVEWLNAYPYGCLEQTTSCAWPMLAARHLVRAGILDAEAGQTMAWKIPAAAARIAGMAVPGGGYAMWPGGLYPAHPYVNIYAAHFVSEANRLGLTSCDIGSKTTEHLRSIIESSGANNRFNTAYAAYVLAIAGYPDYAISAMRNIMLSDERDAATWLAVAGLAKAGHAGECADVLAELADIDPASIVRPDNCYMNEAATLGMVLYAMTDVLPDSAATLRIAERVSSLRRSDGSGWGTPQANAWALLGLSRFCAEFPPAAIEALLSTAGGGSVAIGLSAGDASRTWSQKFDGAPATLSNNGKSHLFAMLRTTGVSRTPPQTQGPVRVSREIFDADGKKVEGPIAHGDLLEVRITIENGAAMREAVLCDLLPGGLEIEDPRLATRTAVPSDDSGPSGVSISCIERGDDRFLLFADLEPGRHVVSYRVRAVTPGRFAAAPVSIECMYDPDVFGIFFAPETIEISR